MITDLMFSLFASRALLPTLVCGLTIFLPSLSVYKMHIHVFIHTDYLDLPYIFSVYGPFALRDLRISHTGCCIVCMSAFIITHIIIICLSLNQLVMRFDCSKKL